MQQTFLSRTKFLWFTLRPLTAWLRSQLWKQTCYIISLSILNLNFPLFLLLLLAWENFTKIFFLCREEVLTISTELIQKLCENAEVWNNFYFKCSYQITLHFETERFVYSIILIAARTGDIIYWITIKQWSPKYKRNTL